MPKTEIITSILDLLDDQLEHDLMLADTRPNWFGKDGAAQTRTHIKFFLEMLMDMGGGNE